MTWSLSSRKRHLFRQPLARRRTGGLPPLLRVDRLEDRLAPATFIVDTTADGGLGSFRQAILDANSTPGPDAIHFNIGLGGLQTISPLSGLPTITDPIVIDGSTQ